MPEPDVIAEGGMIKNTGNTHTLRHAGRILAVMEACPPTELDRDLATIGELDFDGRLAGACTAHPKIDPVSGEMLFFGYSPFPPYLRYHVVDASGALVHSTDIDLPNPVMLHDFAVTEQHVIFLDSPALFDAAAMMSGGSDDAVGTRGGNPHRRDAASGRRRGDIRWFDVDNQYVVHFFNAWDDGDRVEIRAPRFSAMPGAFDFDDPTGKEAPMPWSWSIDLAAGYGPRRADRRPGRRVPARQRRPRHPSDPLPLQLHGPHVGVRVRVPRRRQVRHRDRRRERVVYGRARGVG